MPFVLIIAGTVLLISSIRNTYGQKTPTGGPGLGALVQGDFTGSNNFTYWVVSLLIIGAVGYIPKLKPISVGFMTLVIIVLFLTKGNPNGIGGGFFSQFTQQLGTTQTNAQVNATTSAINAGVNQVTSTAQNQGGLLSLVPNIPGIPSI